MFQSQSFFRLSSVSLYTVCLYEVKPSGIISFKTSDSYFHLSPAPFSYWRLSVNQGSWPGARVGLRHVQPQESQDDISRSRITLSLPAPGLCVPAHSLATFAHQGGRIARLNFLLPYKVCPVASGIPPYANESFLAPWPQSMLYTHLESPYPFPPQI